MIIYSKAGSTKQDNKNNNIHKKRSSGNQIFRRILTNIEKLQIFQNIILYKNESYLESLFQNHDDKATI